MLAGLFLLDAALGHDLAAYCRRLVPVCFLVWVSLGFAGVVWLGGGGERLEGGFRQAVIGSMVGAWALSLLGMLSAVNWLAGRSL
jgi:hypothetical protein